MERRPTKNQEAYELYLMGNKCFERWEPEKGFSYYQRAIELDPQFAEAYLGLACLYPNYSDEPYGKYFKKYIDKALEINKNLPQAYILIARHNYAMEWNFPAAEENFKKAFSLNPGLAEAHIWYSQYLLLMGRYSEAVREIERARELDPLSMDMFGQAMTTYIALGEFDKAMEMYRKSQEINPGSIYPLTHLIRVYYLTGKYKEALDTSREWCIKGNTDPKISMHNGIIYALSGEREKAKQIIEALEAENEYPQRNYGIALIYASLGDSDKAITWLEKAYKNREFAVVFIKCDPEWNPIRSDPRYKPLLKKMGLPED